MLANLISSSGLNVYRALLQFVFNVALTHYLAPAEFGIVNFILPLVTLVILLGDFGLSTAVVRDRDLGEHEAGAAFTLSVFVALLLGFAVNIALWLLPDPRALEVRPIIVAFSVVPLLSLATIVPRALVERKLAYRSLAAIEAIAISSGALCGLILAAQGAGVWSLVAFHLITQAVRFAGFFLLSCSDIRANLRWSSTRRLLSFGSWVFGSSLLTFLFRNGDNIIIGAMLGPAALGAYAFAYQFIVLPLMVLTWPASGVLLATFSRLRPDAGEARKVVGSVICLTATATFPTTAFLVIEGPYILPYVLGPQWQLATQIAAILAPIGALQSLSSYIGPTMLIRGRAKSLFLLNLATTVLTLLLFTAVAWFGWNIVQLCWVYLMFSTVIFMGTLMLMFTMLGMTWSSVARILWLPCLASALGSTAAMIVHLSSRSVPVSTSSLLYSSLAFVMTTMLTLVLQRRLILEHLSSVVRMGGKNPIPLGAAP
ncbi:oligosaccharide flippase family protein [Bradyrhizobium sp. SHOUNA76]|uniref:oligosaccharide flippase family protein n=1 Tax=Bradyrhizobium sp. SHOUNA76 TaxID=2908927 RepID=UPI001FF5B8C6|nr:oligosaccharide flippase family protein [Bradyrhizobium sp. SHOUNA76]MCJ9701408.1 oligosaccharide flippase family protein [Bradyrhizobium sp. SHOUNA76]